MTSFSQRFRSLVCFATFVLGAAVLSAQAPVSIKVNDARPMKASIDEVEQLLGIPINYEDPRFEAQDEIKDITDEVQSPRQKAANPNVRILVPKGGQLTLQSTAFVNKATISDVMGLITQLRAAHDAAGLAGRFAVQQVGSMITVEPQAIRGLGGNWKSTTSALDVPVTFSQHQRNAMEALQLLLAEVSRKIEIKVGIGGFPIHAFVNTSEVFDLKPTSVELRNSVESRSWRAFRNC